MASWLSPSRTGCLRAQTGSTDRQPLQTSLAGRPGPTRAGAPLRRMAIAKQQGKDRWGQKARPVRLGASSRGVWDRPTGLQGVWRSPRTVAAAWCSRVSGHKAGIVDPKCSLSGWTGALSHLQQSGRDEPLVAHAHVFLPRMPCSSSWLDFMLPKGAGWWQRRAGSHSARAPLSTNPLHSFRLSCTRLSRLSSKHWVPLELATGPGPGPELGPAGYPRKQPLPPCPGRAQVWLRRFIPKPLSPPPKSGTTNKKESL